MIIDKKKFNYLIDIINTDCKNIGKSRGFILRERSNFYRTPVKELQDLTDAPVLPRQQKHISGSKYFGC